METAHSSRAPLSRRVASEYLLIERARRPRAAQAARRTTRRRLSGASRGGGSLEIDEIFFASGTLQRLRASPLQGTSRSRGISGIYRNLIRTDHERKCTPHSLHTHTSLRTVITLTAVNYSQVTGTVHTMVGV